MSVKSSDAAATRERQPFKIVDADGHTTELTYSSPHPAADHDEQAVLDELPWFETGQPLHNWMLHETDFYDEVEQIWRDFRIIEVPVEEYWDLAVNAVTLEPGKLVMNAESPSTLRALEREGVEVIQVDFSESHKFAIAGLHCATLELMRDQPESPGT
jgi:arginine deiminase